MGGSRTSNSGRSGAARHGGRRLLRAGRLGGRVSVAVAIGALTLPLATAVAAVAGTGSPASAAGVNPALTCSAGTIYNLMSNGNFYALNTTSGADAAAAPSKLGPSTSDDNALGISSNGQTAYSMIQAVSGGNLTLDVTTVSTGAAAAHTVPAGNITNDVAGGVDPVNGDFYYGGWNSADTVFYAFVFNGTTGVEVGSITPGGVEGSGDLAFDGLGNLYVLVGTKTSGQIDEVNASALPASGTGALTFKVLASLSGGGNFDGIAFAANGSLYAEDGNGDLYAINPNNGGVSPLITQTGYSGTPVDLASCAYNGTLSLEKNIVGRVGTSDQFALSITGGGIASGNTGTTSGSTTGLQTASSEEAGPVVGIPGTVYSIAETAAGGANLANYASSYNCTNFGTTVSGSGTSATLPSFPAATGNTGAAVACTFTNTPASISVLKTPSVSSVSAAGNTVTYTFAIKNTGPLALTKVGVSDALASPSSSSNLSAISCVGGTNGSLSVAAGGTASCSATYTVSPADITKGSIVDTATASGTAPGGGVVTGTSNATVAVTANPQIALTKTSSVPSVSAPGTVTYTFTASNPGNETLTGVHITDSANFTGLSAFTCAGGETNGSITLAAGGSEACTATESVTQAQIDAGTTLTDTGTVTGNSPSGITPATVSANAGPVNVTITQNPSLKVVKTASVSSVTAANQTFTYTFAVTNNGNVTESNIAISDAQSPASGDANLGTITCPQTSLAPAGTENCTATYTVSQADMDNGSISDTADATGKTPSGATTTSPGSSASVTATQAGGITITKSASAASVSAPGTVTYTFVVKNSGNVSLSGATITDSANFSGLSALSCANSETNGSIALAVGASETCTATESVTQAQIDAGTSLVDTGSVSAATPASDTTQTSVSASSNQATVSITQSPSLKVVKTASVSAVSAAGATFTYTFAVTNNGNTDEYNVNIADAQTAPSVGTSLSAISCPNTSSTPLAPGASENCTATYTVSQADMDNGSISDTAKATGNSGSPTGPAQTSSGSGATVTATQSPSLSLTKSASVTQVSQMGQQVTYSFLVTNTGNVSVNSIAISDAQQAPSVNSSLTAITCPKSSLAPGANETCMATYTVTQQDLNHGSITDTATASGKTAVGTGVTSNSSTATIQAVQIIMSGRAYDVGLDVGLLGVALVGPVTVNDTGGVDTAAATATPTPCVAAAAVKDLTITGDVCAGVQTVKSLNTSIATSSIANLALGVAGIPAVVLQAVQSTSTTSCSGSTGSVTIAFLSVGGVTVISKPTTIAPNTGLNLGVVTLELNQQIPFNIGGDAGLTVNAVHVTVNALGLAGVNLVVGSSTSDIQCAVPAQAPVLTGEANDVELLGAALGTTVGANVVVNDTSPVITDQASTTTPPCVASAAVVDLTLTGDVCASVTTKPTSGDTPASSTATASVANVVLGLGIPAITLQGVQSTSTTSCTASSGSMTIAYLKIGTTVVVSKTTAFAPNSEITVGGITLTLNQQIAFGGADSGLIVNAVAISVNTGGLLTAYGTVASSTSDILDC